MENENKKNNLSSALSVDDYEVECSDKEILSGLNTYSI